MAVSHGGHLLSALLASEGPAAGEERRCQRTGCQGTARSASVRSACLPGVALPGRAGPIAWVTDGLVEDPGLVWSALSPESTATGLVPFLAATLEDEGSRAQIAESLAGVKAAVTVWLGGWK
jgi:hypothetical protein